MSGTNQTAQVANLGTNKGEMMEELMTPKEVCEYLKVSYATFRRMCRDGKIDYGKVGVQIRVKRKDLEKVLTLFNDDC